jgi:dTMP kinase
LEGIDGCGKSTQFALLADWLRERGVEPVVVREPGGTVLGEELRRVLLDPASGDVAPGAEALLYAASRAQLVRDVIKPALEAGRVLIADRFVDSSLAYQGGGRGLGVERVRAVNELALDGLLPTLTIFLRLDPRVAAARAAATGDPDRIEAAGSAFFDRVADAYELLAAAEPDRFVVIDAAESIEAVSAHVRDAVDARMPAQVTR